MTPFRWADVWIGLNLVDAATTLWLVNHGGQEMNPLLAPLVSQWPAYFVALKLVAAIVIAAACLQWSRRLLYCGTAGLGILCSYHTLLIAVWYLA